MSPPSTGPGAGALRVLHVAHAWPPGGGGGTERYAAALVAAQAAAGAVTAAFAPGAPGWEAPPARRGFTATWAHPGVEATFAARVAGFRPDVVHLHHLSGLSLRLAALARPARVVLSLHDYWLRCARGQLATATGAPCSGPTPDRCARCLAPVLWGPLPLVDHLPPRRAPIRARETAVADLLREVDLVLAPSAHLPARMGIPALVHDLPLLAPLPPRPTPAPGPPRFGFVGALLPTKGIHLLLEAFAGLPAGAGTLVVIGPSPSWNGRDWAEGLPRGPGVRFRGPLDPVPWEEIDVLVFPSTWDENHPLVLVEAGALGLRVVAADVPGARAVAPGARFFAPGSVPGLRAALAAEVSRGRARGPLRAAPALAVHAADLLDRYAALGPAPARNPPRP